MQHFLLVYDHDRQTLILTREFNKNECVEATEAYQQAEVQYRHNRNIEIVLIGADSIETIKRTHGHYFGRSPSPMDRYLTGV